ncbi:MAG: large subunit ribosomal protein [Actinomycetota bacterium]|jgi:large subunit ribosomal protein L29
MTKAAELEALDDTELEQRLADAKQELFNLRFKVVTGQFDNTSRLGYLKKDVARIHTILRAREIEAAEAAEAATQAVPQESA